MLATSFSVSSRLSAAGLPISSERAGNFFSSGTSVPGRHDRVLADLGAVQQHRAHADQHAIVDRAAVQHGGVADGHVVADARWHACRASRE